MGPSDEDCMVTRIKRGRDPFYDLTQDDEELKEAFAEVGEEDILFLQGNWMWTTFRWLVWKQLMKLRMKRPVDCLQPMQILNERGGDTTKHGSVN